MPFGYVRPATGCGDGDGHGDGCGGEAQRTAVRDGVRQHLPHYVTKVEKKGRTKRELDEVLRWFTGYNQRQLTAKVRNGTTLGDFIDGAPELHPHRSLITGVVCGVRVENIDEPVLREVRYMDKPVDELSKGKAMEKVLRSPVDA